MPRAKPNLVRAARGQRSGRRDGRMTAPIAPSQEGRSERHAGGTKYYAYRIEGDTICIEDTCHAQNMHEATQRGENQFPISTRKHIAHMITENVMRKIRLLI